MNLRIVVLIVVLGIIVVGGKSNFPFNNWAIFGDSLTDTGNIYTSEGFPQPPYYNGRYSNGPVWIEYLAPMLQLPAPKASLEGGINYAYGGATSGYGVTVDVCCSSYCCIYSDGKEDGYGVNAANQTQYYLNAHQPNSKTLIVIWIGANDVLNFISTKTTMANILAQITLLINKGVKYFLIVNLPDLGLAPLYYGTPFQTLASEAAIDFNTALGTTIAGIQANFSDVTFYTPDLYELSSDTAFINARGVLLQSAQALSRVNITNPESQIIVSVNASIDAWWDYEHPTTNLHKAVADYIAIYTFNVTSSANTVYTALTSTFFYCSLLNILFFYF